MILGTATITLGGLVLVGLLLNALWEMAQMRPLYTCWERWRPWQRLAYPVLCIAGDVVALIGLVYVAIGLFSPGNVIVALLLLVVLGFLAGTVLEWIARELELWDYKPRMPTFRVHGQDVGVVPVLQMTLLPALTVFLLTL